MVLADSHTISKSIYNDDKVDNNIFDSIRDVDHPTNSKTRKERQEKKLYYNKEEDVAPPNIHRETKSYELDKTTEKAALKTTKTLTTEHVKHHKPPKKRVGFWRKFRGKDKKKETFKHDPNDRKRRIINHKNKEHKNFYQHDTIDSRNPGPKPKSRRKSRKKFSPRQPELKVSKREAGALFSTRPYSNTPQNYKLQMGIAPQVDNMLKNKYVMQSETPFTTVMEAHSNIAENMVDQLQSITNKMTLLKEKYGVYGSKPSHTESSSEDNALISGRFTTKTPERIFTTSERNIQATAQIEMLLNNMKERAMQMASYEKPLVTELIKNCVTEASYNHDRHVSHGVPAPRDSLTTYISINDVQTLDKTTAETMKSDEYNKNDYKFSANTESHYIAARSIGEDTMTIAQNVEDMLQRELKNLYNKVKHKVSSDLRKEMHTAKSTAKETYSKITAKLSSKCKAAKANCTHSSSTKANTKAKPKTCACTTTIKKKKTKPLSTTAVTTPRVKKKDNKDEDRIIVTEHITPETQYAAKTYDDYLMLTLYEQMLAKTHDDNFRRMLATSENPMLPKYKRETLRLSKRNPETLADVKLKEVIRSIYDDGGNMPDYDYIEPAANVTSTGKTTAANIYQDFDYEFDSSGSSGNSAQDPLMGPLKINNKGKGTASAPAEAEINTEANRPAEDSSNADSTLLDTSFEGLSSKISYNEFVNGYKHYLKFQQDQKNQNFSNLVKYQAHRHHSVDDIGKYILSKIPPLPTYNKKKRERRFSDDSDNNMDYQEITTKSEDSWFKKHFYLFIDSGPPKKYHTSETVELKSTEPKLFITEPTNSKVRQTKQHFIKIEPNSFPRKAKNAQAPPSLDDLSRVLDSIKEHQSNSLLSNVKPNNEDQASMPVIDNNNAIDDTVQVKSLISKLFGKRRNAPKNEPITVVYFPTPTYMYPDSEKGRLRRSVTQESIENSIMTDFITKDIEVKASTPKELFADIPKLGSKEPNKYGYVDIDLVPRQTAVVKLRDAKKSRFKNFFKKFHFKKKKKKESKPKRSCYYNYYTQSRRRERFNPIKKLKAMFNVKEAKEEKTDKFSDYDIATTQIDPFKPVKFVRPMSLDEMQKQVPNISDSYFEPSTTVQTIKADSQVYGLDAKDEDLLYNFHPQSGDSSVKQPATTQKNAAVTPFVPIFSNSTAAMSSTTQAIATSKNIPAIMKAPNSNVLTVNVKTMGPIAPKHLSTEALRKLTIDDMSLMLDNMQDKIQKSEQEFPTMSTVYNPSHVRQTGIYNYKKTIGKPRIQTKSDAKQPKNTFEELVIKGKLTRIAKFPINKRPAKIKAKDNSESFNVGQDYSNFYGPSVLEYIHDLGNRNAPYERKKQVKGTNMNKLHYSPLPKPTGKDKNIYTDYFNDLVMWHNDILNLDKVPNPQWEKILKILQSDSGNGYTTPDMNQLMIELDEMNEMMDPGRKLNNSINRFSNGTLNGGPSGSGPVGVRAFRDKMNEQGLIKSVAMQDNTLITSKDMVIRGEAKYYQLKKPQLPENKHGSSGLFNNLNRFTVERTVSPKLRGGRRFTASPSESYPAIIVDTTLMAYDDDMDFVSKALEPNKKYRNFQKPAKVRNKMDLSWIHNIKKATVDEAKNSQKPEKLAPKNKMDRPAIMKTNSAPLQYYTTPLPMKSKDFNKFLKENDIDVEFVTSPILDLPTIKEWTMKKYKQTTISTGTAFPTPTVQEAAPAVEGATPHAKAAAPNIQESGSNMKEAAPNMQDALQSMQEAAPNVQGIPQSMHGKPPQMQGAPREMQGAAPETQVSPPNMLASAPSRQGAPTNVQEYPPAVQEAPPLMQEAPSSVQEAPPAPAAKASPDTWTTQRIDSLNPEELLKPSPERTTKKKRVKGKTENAKGFSKQLKDKVDSFTKALSKSVKFTTDHPKAKPKHKKPAHYTNKATFWDDDFGRFKRYSQLKLSRNTADPDKGTQEANYYSIFKKKMKERLFEKKTTPMPPLDLPATDSRATDTTRNKEVEITIINFDDLEKMSSQVPYETFSFPAQRREESTYTDFIDLSNSIKAKNKNKTTPKATEEALNDEIHNELLYKDVFSELSTTTTKEYSSKNSPKSTEYVNPILNDGNTGIANRMRYPYEKMSIYPNILSKVIPHSKNFNGMPKRVHISSHHYKYDVFYDDHLKHAGKTSGIDGFQSIFDKISTNAMRPVMVTGKRTPASEKGENIEIIKKIDRTAKRNRHRRRVWGPEAPHNKKRKFFTFRGSKAKSTGGVREPREYFKNSKNLTLSSAEDSTPLVSTGTQLKEALSAAGENTDRSVRTRQAEKISSGDNTAEFSTRTEPFTKEDTYKSSWTWPSESVSDIDDLVTMFDEQEDIDDVVTLSALQSEYWTSITIRENIRRAVPSPTSTTMTPALPATKTTTKAPTTTTKAPTTTTGATKTTAAIKTTVASTSQPGSIVYDLKKLKKTTTSKPNKHGEPSGKEEKNLSGPDKDRHRRLFKISSMLQNRFKNIMKNFTATTKLSTSTMVLNATTQAPKSHPKRTCVISTTDHTESEREGDDEEDGTEMVMDEIEDVNEGFKFSFKPPVCPEQKETAHHRAHEKPSYHHQPGPTPPPVHHHRHHHYHHTVAPPFQEEIVEPETSPPHHTTYHKPTLPIHQDIQENVVYLEPEIYNDQAYYEDEHLSNPPVSTLTTPRRDEHFDYKREAPLNTYTAKDVAALEVIVDLMKNTLSYEENNLAGGYQQRDTFIEQSANRPNRPNGSTNAIQVHIAIPFDFQNGKKRSPSIHDPVRVRKIFCAKMSTPVDLEYQVHSFEGTIPPTSTRMTDSIHSTGDRLSPGMYLLIDQTRNGYGLKPVLSEVNLSDLKSRQVAAGTTASMSESKPTETREETTSLKNLAKVTLSKDFVAAVNQHLIEMYENMSRVNKDVNNSKRSARSVWKSRKLKEKQYERKRSADKYIVKRGIDWEAVKRFFGHDRVCNCKCKSNKAMCRACAASDAVIDELIFEFDNIGRYMADHCTEIQTFFWMNPLGGQKLRESVNKIDKSLTDYYKRVRGKCQGRLCKTFTTYIDKKRFTKTYKIKKEDSMSHLLNDLAVLAEDLNRTISLQVCYNDKLKESGDKFIRLMNTCLLKKSLKKRCAPNTTPKKMVKNVYSLDNINVNIICHPESSTADEQMFTAGITGIQDTSQHLLSNFDLGEATKKHKGLRKLFPRKSKKSKLLSYFEFNKKPKTNFKRQVNNQVVTPLISDGGGAFWYDYLKAGTSEPRLVRDSVIDKNGPNIEVAVVQKPDTTATAILTEAPSTQELVTNSIYMTLETVPNSERNQRDVETSTDTLSKNINQMLQLFGSLQDVEAMNNDLNRSIKSSKKVTKPEKEVKSASKPKKPSLMSKVKQKMAWSKNKTTTRCASEKSTLVKKLKELTTIEHEIEAKPKTITLKNAPQKSENDILQEKNNALMNSTEAMAVNSSTYVPSTKIVSTTAKSVATNCSAITTTVSHNSNVASVTTAAPKKEENSNATPTSVNKSSTRKSFMNKFKAATNLFRKEKNIGTTELVEEKPTSTSNNSELVMPLNSGVIDIVTDADNKVMDYVIEESPQNATQNPTIVIINEYENKINSGSRVDKEEFKNLLLSIIQFETNNLNEEWDKVAYSDRHINDADMKISVVNQPKVENVIPVTLMATPIPTTTSSHDLVERGVTTKQPDGLLNKIVSKMGIKVINNKDKKVVKKANIRQVRKDKKNFIKNRKIRINSRRLDTLSPTSNKEASHYRRSAKPSQICDIQATYDHLKTLQRSIPAEAFEMVVKNITCHRYKHAHDLFVIPYKRKGKRWDWIRNKRSLKLHFYNKDEPTVDDEAYVVNFEDDSNDSFERFAKGDDGIYKIETRRKRTANLESLERGLRNIPNLMPGEDELYVMAGDSVIMDCGLHAPVKTCDAKFVWKTDRSRMLKQDNVEVDDVSLKIKNVEPKNVGTYTCSLDHTVRKTVRLSVLTVPAFDIVFLPVYKTQDNCSYDDLKAIQRLGSLMANETHCGKACSIRIDEPVCQRDKATNSTLVRAAAVITMTPRALNCSLQCKRDIVSSLVMLCTTNAAVLSSIKVLVSKDGVNETLTPWRDLVRPVVTHTLRKKDTNGHHEYHKLVSLLAPGKVDVVLICPAGYYLLPKYKLCSSCPPNTSSKTGDNTCRSCPRGTRAEPGASKCHLVQSHPRRYDWWWYPPCGYLVACCGVLFGCTACVLLSLIVHVLSRDAELREREGADDEGQKTPGPMRRVSVAYAHTPGTRPLSPSRVILPRFFRPSLTSSRATDSQETKFELWKERNRPPPLPPIDFDP